ncbi:MAG: hypothetical protein RR605_13060 [Acinetobacter sp.]
MIIPSLNAGLAQLRALASFIDSGSNNATFIFYDDTKPSSITTPANNSAKLVTLTIPKPCFKKLNSDNIELHQTDAATVIKTGTAAWARLFNGDGNAVADFAVGADIILANPSLIIGSTLMMNSIILRPSV